MRETTLFSIIIPVYDVERYLRQCLDSVLAQTSSCYEVILVNDCSPDSCDLILGEYLERLPNPTVIRHRENLGLGAARNSGLQAASGEYVVFLDSDDTLEPDAVRYLEQAIDADQGIELIRYNYSKTGDKVNGQPDPLTELSGLRGLDRRYAYLFSLPCYACLCCVKRAFIVEHGLAFLNMINEDVPWTTYLFANATVSLLDRRIYNYRIREGSISTRSDYDINAYIRAYRSAAEVLPAEKRFFFFNGCADKVVNYCSFFLRRKGCTLSGDNRVFMKHLLRHVRPRGWKMVGKVLYLQFVLRRMKPAADISRRA